MQPEIDAAAVTVLLKELQEGNSAAADRLIPVVFRELRNLAELYMRREGPRSHTLQPTALVHEAYLRLMGDQARDWQNRAQFIGVAASIMRRLLIDHARRKRAEKRQLPESREWHAGMTTQEAEHLLDLNFALDRLEKSNARYARVVELRYFGGLSIEEAAEVLQTSPMTVKRDWTAARAWLKQQMQPAKNDPYRPPVSK
ncbi:MAG: sigma-70 family RNA polymerase sigma factor [Acidobacteriaceae bacterium]|nr:sigma-70 family RNA polymerase sigma factor [Acidobacteriaceae bacterium]